MAHGLFFSTKEHKDIFFSFRVKSLLGKMMPKGTIKQTEKISISDGTELGHGVPLPIPVFADGGCAGDV